MIRGDTDIFLSCFINEPEGPKIPTWAVNMIKGKLCGRQRKAQPMGERESKEERGKK